MKFTVVVGDYDMQFRSYEHFVRDEGAWEDLQRDSLYNGTGGDWRYISHIMHSAITKAIEQGNVGKWIGIFEPYSTPPIAFRLDKEDI